MSHVAGAVPFADARSGEAIGGRPVLAGLTLSNPAAIRTQGEMLELLGLAGDDFACSIFERSGVRTRRLDVSPGSVRRSLQERAAETEEALFAMVVDALDRLDFDPARVGLVLTANYYSVGGPTLAHRVIERYALPEGADKYHVTGVGCASAAPLVRLAAQALRDRPAGEQALLLAAERVSGFLRHVEAGDEKAKTVGSALFADGCAAVLLGLGPDVGGASGPEVVGSAVHQVPGTLDHVRFVVRGGDSYMSISRELPELAESGLPALVDSFLAKHGLERADVDHWVLHPGGRGIIEGAQRGLGLSDEQVAPSARVLAELGNMGTPSSFFVLRATEEMRSPRPGELGLVVAIGPGVTVGLMLLNWTEGGTK